MKIFPIDPSPYAAVYAIAVFLCPWCIYGYFVIKEYIHIAGHYQEFLFIFKIKTFKEIKATREKDEKWKTLHANTIKWLKITILSWLLGFIFLASIMYWLESHNLLINHSKGIY
jgi:hypothetical protein